MIYRTSTTSSSAVSAVPILLTKETRIKGVRPIDPIASARFFSSVKPSTLISDSEVTPHATKYASESIALPSLSLPWFSASIIQCAD